MNEKELKIDIMWIPILFIIPMLIFGVLGMFGFSVDYWTCFWLYVTIRLILDPPELTLRWWNKS